MSGRSSTRQLRLPALLALAAAAALPSTAQADVVVPESVTGAVEVPPGQTRSLTLRCPPTAVALNGASPNAASSIPRSNARSWRFRFSAGARAERGRAVLRCVRLSLPRRVAGVGVAVGTIIEPILEIPPGGSRTLGIRCPSGQMPTGWGLQRAGGAAGLSIARAVPTRSGWAFTVENSGPAGADGKLRIRCLERRQRATSGQRHAFAVRIASFTEQIDGDGTASRSCRRREYSVATGVSLPTAGSIVMTATVVFGPSGGEWTFAQPSGSTAVTTSIVCLARTTRFHR